MWTRAWQALVVTLAVPGLCSCSPEARARRHFDRGAAAAEKQDWDGAIAEFTRAIELRPECAEAYSNRGWAYRGKGDVDRAIQDCTRAIEIKPDYAQAYYHRGCAFTRVQRWDQAIQDYTRATELKPDHAGAYCDRGGAYTMIGELDRGLEDLTRGLEMGELVRLEDDLPSGLGSAPATPHCGSVYFMRGYNYLLRGDWDRAIQDFSRSIELAPDRAAIAGAYTWRATIYIEQGDHDRAIQDCTRAIELQPDLVLARITRGRAYSGKGAWDRAQADCAEAVEIGPEDPRACAAMAWLLATCPENRVRDGKKALEYARRSCEATGWREASCLSALAAACAEVGQYDEAAKWQRKVLEDPKYVKRCGEEARARLKLYEEGKPHRE